MHKNIALTIIFTALSLNFSYGAINSQKKLDTNLDTIVAVVNDDVITSTELNKKIDIIKKQSLARGVKLPPIAEIKKQVLNSMVLEALQLQVAKLNNISAMPEQINEALDTIAKQNNTNPANFKKKLQQEGVDYSDFKKDIVNQLTIMNIQRAIAANEIKINAQEIKQEMARLNNAAKSSYKISHILISLPNSPDSNKIQLAKDRAEQILKDIKNGKDFANVAMIASDGQQALQGGDLGWFSSADIPSTFAEVAPKLTKGQVYGPIHDESGFHIIKLTDVKHDSKRYQETQYKVRHILIKNDDITSNILAEKELAKISNDIKKNNNFADLALIYSEDVASASKGGDLGWISSYAVQPEFAQVVESLKINEISKPFKTVYGWHIAKLEDKKIVDNTESWKKGQAKQIIENRKFQDALALWQNKIKSESMIKILI